jgi:hypothetical protein
VAPNTNVNKVRGIGHVVKLGHHLYVVLGYFTKENMNAVISLTEPEIQRDFLITHIKNLIQELKTCELSLIKEQVNQSELVLEIVERAINEKN